MRSVSFMRTLGPGSIASLLKIALDVAYVAIWAAAAVSALALLIGVLAIPFLGSRLPGTIEIDGRIESLQSLLSHWPAALAALASVILYLVILLVIFFRLRRVFSTLTAGDPFRPENVGRLRTVGLALIALEGAGYLVRLAVSQASPVRGHHSGSISLSAWFAILVVFVLAEVFREGARLRRDAELTI